MRLLFDSTNVLRWAFEEPVGTVRVERVVLGELRRHVADSDLAFVNCDLRRFVHIGAAEQSLIETLRADPWRRIEHGRTGPETGLEHEPFRERDARPRRAGRLLWLKGMARRVIDRYPAQLREPARHAAHQLYVGSAESLRIAWRAARLARPPAAPAAANPESATDFSSFTDLLTIGNGWDYLGYEALHAMKVQHGVRIHGFVHDLIAIDHPYFFHDPAQASILHRHYAELCHLCTTLICNSSATEAALRRFIRVEGLPTPHIAVAQLGSFVGSDASLPSVRPGGFPDREFVLYVSTLEIRKNHRLLLRVWRSLCERARKDGRTHPCLVLVGRVGWGADEAINMINSDPALAGNAMILSGLSDGALSWLHEHCLFAVYPSLIEGWGLPISEALAHGRAVLHATDPAQSEAAQGLMPSVSPDDFDGWRTQIDALIHDAAKRARLERAAREQFRRRSGSDFVDDLFAAITAGGRRACG